MKRFISCFVSLILCFTMAAQEMEYYKSNGGGACVFSTSNYGCIITVHNGIQCQSVPVNFSGRNNNGDFVYTVSGVPFVIINSTRSTLSALSGTLTYTRCTQAEAEDAVRLAAALQTQTGNYSSGSSNYASGAGNTAGTAQSSGYSFKTSTTATVISTGYGQASSRRSDVNIYQKGSSYYIKIGSQYHVLSRNSSSDYLGHSTNGANYVATIGSAFYYVRIY